MQQLPLIRNLLTACLPPIHTHIGKDHNNLSQQSDHCFSYLQASSTLPSTCLWCGFASDGSAIPSGERLWQHSSCIMCSAEKTIGARRGNQDIHKEYVGYWSDVWLLWSIILFMLFEHSLTLNCLRIYCQCFDSFVNPSHSFHGCINKSFPWVMWVCSIVHYGTHRLILKVLHLL